MPEDEPRRDAVAVEPYLRLELNREEAWHVLRALLRAAHAVRSTTSDERPTVPIDAEASIAIHDRLLKDVGHRDLELGLYHEGPND